MNNLNPSSLPLPAGRLAAVLGAISICLGLPGSPVALAEWHEFRGPQGNGRAAPQLPLNWSASKQVRWRSELPGEGWSSPIVVGDSIYVTAAIAANGQASADGKPDLDLCLLTLDAKTGKLRGRIELFQQPGATSAEIHRKNSHASPTPVFDGQNIFVHFGHQGTACVAPSGAVLWRNEDLSYAPVHGNGGSPVVVNDLLIFSRDGKDISEVTALDKTSGEIRWQAPRNIAANKRFSFCTPLVLRQQGLIQLIIPGSNVVQSLDPATGTELWRVNYEGYSVIPKPIFEAGLVFISTSYDRPTLLAIDPSGRGDVTQTHVRWQTSSAAIPHTPSLVGWDGKVAMISDKGIAACYDARTGAELWKERIGGNFSSSPLLSGQHLYLQSEEGDCTVLDISSSPREVAKNTLGERTLASFAVIDQDILLRSAQALYRIHQPPVAD